MSTRALDPKRCPLCHEPNECGLAAGKSKCWCFTQHVPEEVLARVPPEARGVACVCALCASGRRHPNEVMDIMTRLTKRH
ncbi:MAG: cysteine-rich CWC family protein [Myxococcota bacterium]